VKNVAITISHGETIAIAVKLQKQEAAVETVVVEITEAGIAEEATTEEVIEAVTIVAHHAENIEGAMIADPHDAIPENLVDGGPKARAGLADAEISRKAFI